MASKTGIPKPPSPVAKNYANPVALNTRVLLSGKRYGTVRYVGKIYNQEGEWYGIELDNAKGEHDGAINSERYFQCSPKHGLFVRRKEISTLRELQRTQSLFVAGSNTNVNTSAEATIEDVSPPRSERSDSGSRPRKQSHLKAFHHQFALKLVPADQQRSDEDLSPTSPRSDSISENGAEDRGSLTSESSTVSSRSSSVSNASAPPTSLDQVASNLRVRSLDGVTMKLFAHNARQPSEVFQNFAASHLFLRDKKEATSSDHTHDTNDTSASTSATTSTTTTTTDSRRAGTNSSTNTDTTSTTTTNASSSTSTGTSTTANAVSPIGTISTTANAVSPIGTTSTTATSSTNETSSAHTAAAESSSPTFRGDKAALSRVEELKKEMSLLKTNHENVVAVLRDTNRQHARNVLELRAQVALLMESKQELEKKLEAKDKQVQGLQQTLSDRSRLLAQQDKHQKLLVLYRQMELQNVRLDQQVDLWRSECERLREELMMMRELTLLYC